MKKLLSTVIAFVMILNLSNVMLAYALSPIQFVASFQGPAAQDIYTDSNDAVLTELTFSADGDVEVRNLTVTLTSDTGDGLIADDGNANFTDIKLVRLDVDGNVVETLMGPVEVDIYGDDEEQSFDLPDTFAMNAYTVENVAITCDVSNNDDLDGTTIKATLNAISQVDGVWDPDVAEYVTDIVPGVDIVGNTMTVSANGPLSVSLASSPVSDTVVGGANDIALVGFAFHTPASYDGVVTSIMISGYLDVDGDGVYGEGGDGSTDLGNVVTTVWLEDSDGNQVSNFETFDGNGEAMFSGLNLGYEAGEVFLLRVVGDFSQTAPYEGYETNYVAVNIDDVSTDVIVENMYGNAVSVEGGDLNVGPAVRMEVVEFGELTMQESFNSQLDDQIAAANTEDLLVGVLRLYAEHEDFEVNKLTLTFTDETGDLATAPDLVDAIESVTLVYPTEFDDPETLDGLRTGFIVGSGVTFTSLGMVAPNDDYSYAEVYVNLNDHGLIGGLDSDDELYLTVDNTTGDFEAVGQASGYTFDEGDYSDITCSNATYVYRSVPTVANDTALGSSLVMGADQEVYRFTVSADSNARIVLKQLGFDVSSTGLDIGNTWFVTEYGSNTVLGVGRYGSGFAGTRFFRTNVIDAGTTKTYSLYVSWLYDADPMVADEAISVRLHHDDGYHVSAGSFPYIFNALSRLAGLVWSDGGSPYGHGLLSDEWMSGYKVPGFPLDYMTLN